MFNLHAVRFGVVAYNRKFKVGQQFRVDFHHHVETPQKGYYNPGDILEVSKVGGDTPDTLLHLKLAGSSSDKTTAITLGDPVSKEGFFKGCTYIKNTPSAE